MPLSAPFGDSRKKVLLLYLLAQPVRYSGTACCGYSLYKVGMVFPVYTSLTVYFAECFNESESIKVKTLVLLPLKIVLKKA